MRYMYQDAPRNSGSVIEMIVQKPENVKLPMLDDRAILINNQDVATGHGFWYLAGKDSVFYEMMTDRAVPALLENYEQATLIAKWDGEKITVYPKLMSNQALLFFFGQALGSEDMK